MILFTLSPTNGTIIILIICLSQSEVFRIAHQLGRRDNNIHQLFSKKVPFPFILQYQISSSILEIMKIFHIALFAVGVFLESSANHLRGPSRGVRGLMSRIVGGIKANTSEQPHAGYNSRLKLDVTIPVADGSPMSIPIKDLALIPFVMITTNDWNGDGILITEVASALLKGLPN